MKNVLLLLTIFHCFFQAGEGWIPCPMQLSSGQRRPPCQYPIQMALVPEDPLNQKPEQQQQPSDSQDQQRRILEELSLKGAEEISKMGIPERAKRAMLAEAVEDRIFELTDLLDGLIEVDGTVAEKNRKKVVDIATQTKKLQQEYSDLVNGSPSSVLNALDSISKGRGP